MAVILFVIANSMDAGGGAMMSDAHQWTRREFLHLMYTCCFMKRQNN